MTTGVLVMAHGTPANPDGIEAFYTRIRRGSPPSPEQLEDLTRRYAAIGGTSPLTERTAAQVIALRAELERRAPGAFDVRFGSKFEAPLLEEAASSFRDDGVRDVVGLVLAPHASSLSTEQYMARARAALGEDARFAAVGAWFEQPGFAELMASRVLDALARVPVERRANARVVFSAHSLPTKVIEAGDTYAEQLVTSARQAAAAAGLEHFDVAYQSAGRTADPWLGPDILEALRDLAASGVTDVVSCPIGFVADHLEVLFDLDVEAAAVAKDVGLNFIRTASLNDDPRFIAVLGDVVRDAAA